MGICSNRKRPHEASATNTPSTSHGHGHIKDAYKCCSSLIKNLDDMFKHIEVKHPTEISSKWIKCDKCDEHFWSTRLVDCHSLLQHKVQRYSCKVCDKVFQNVGRFNEHDKMDHLGIQSTSKQGKCGICKTEVNVELT